MAISKIQGVMLEDNLLRYGRNLAIETDIFYIDVTGKIGINSNTPNGALDVIGITNLNNLTFNGNTISEGTLAGLNFDLGGADVSFSGSVITNVADPNPSNIQEAVTVNFLNAAIDAIPKNILYDENSVLTIDKHDGTGDTTLDYTPNGVLNVRLTDSTAYFYDEVQLDNVLVTGNLITTVPTSGLDLLINSDTGDVIFTSTSSLVIPVGNTVERPPIPLVGAMRYNTTQDEVELFDGLDWVPVSGNRVGLEQQLETYSINDTTVYLPYISTTDNALVSLSGYLQVPTVAYTITDDVLVFSESLQQTLPINVMHIDEITPVISDLFTGNGVLDTFTLSAPATTNTVIVAISGVVQIPTDNYTVTSTTLLFSTPPIDTAEVSVIATTALGNAQKIITDGIASTFTLSEAATTDTVFVSLNGVVQHPTSAYTVSGTDLIFTAIPEDQMLISIQYITSSESYETTLYDEQPALVLTYSGNTVNILVSVDGVLQLPNTDYTVTDNALTFITHPLVNDEIIIRFLTTISDGLYEEFVGDGVNSEYSLSYYITSENILVAQNGLILTPDVNYTISGNLIDFGSVPTASDTFSVRYLTLDATTQIIIPDGILDVFTLDQLAPEESALVLVNGTIQPSPSAYSISNATITFTSPPLITDDVIIRFMKTPIFANEIRDVPGDTKVKTYNDNIIMNVNFDNIIDIDALAITVSKNIIPSVNTGINLGSGTNQFDDLFINNINSATLNVTGATSLAATTWDSSVLIDAGGNKITNMVNPTLAQDATTKSYVDALVSSGSIWIEPVRNPDFVGVADDEPTAPLVSGMYIAHGGVGYPQTWTGGLSVDEGDMMHWTFGNWENGGSIDSTVHEINLLVGVFTNAVDNTVGQAIPVGIYLDDYVNFLGGDPAVLANWHFPYGRSGFHPGWTATGSASNTITISGSDETASIKAGNKVIFDGTTFTVDTVLFGTDTVITTFASTVTTGSFTLTAELLDGATALTNNTNDSHFGQTYFYSNVQSEWIQISGPGSIDAGTNLEYAGTTLNVSPQGPGSLLDADLLDSQQGTWYQDWTNTTNKPSPTITLGGDASGAITLTELAGGTLTVTIVDDSHNHTIANVDTLQTALDSKLNDTGDTMAGAYTVSTGGSISWTDAPTLGDHLVNLTYVTGLMTTGFTVSDDAGTPVTTVISGGDTLTFNGTTNEITVATGVDSMTIGLPDNVVVAGTLGVTGLLNANDGIAVDTSNFTVDGTTGAITTASTLDVSGTTTLANLTIDAISTVSMGDNVVNGVATPDGLTGTDAVNVAYMDAITTTGWVITDGTNSETITLGGSLTLAGTANEVDVLVSAADTMTIGLPADVTVSNNLTVTGGSIYLGTSLLKNDAGVFKFLESNETTIATIEGNIDGGTY